MKITSIICFLCMFILFSVGFLQAQETDEELAQAASIPLAAMMSFPFQNNIDIGLGEYDRTRNVLNFQPVIPLFKGNLSHG